MIQELKASPEFFQLIWDGKKTAEIRSVADRQFREGESINLLEFDADSGYTGREIRILITHVLAHDDFPLGLQPGFVCLSFKAIYNHPSV